MWWSLAYATVTTAGTPVQATSTQSDANAQVPAHSILFQQAPGNTGKIYICSSNTAVKATGVGVLAILAIPTTNVLPSAAVTLTNALNALNVADFWIDADVSGEKVLISYVQS